MTYRPHPKYASNSAKAGPWSTCDRCGFINSQSDLQWQFDYVGGPVPQSQGWLVCPRCINPLTMQRQLIVLPPDPPPIFNTRPENYTVDETNYLVSQDGDIFETVAGEDYITSMPNPAQNADTAVLVLSAALTTGLTALSVAYLDFFIGDPANGGVSVLALITGSSTRTNVAASLQTNGLNQTVNPDYIVITSAASSITNVTHVGVYSAATSGTLLASGPIGATTPTVVEGAVVQFNQLGLSIQLS